MIGKVDKRLSEICALARLFPVTVVTGAQRSGTTIGARIIAKEAVLTYVDESDYGTKDMPAWISLIKDGDGIVIQSPAMSRYLEDAAAVREDVFFVYMRRNFADIAASEKRIGWSDAVERAAYDAKDSPLSIAEVKYNYWMNTQEKILRHTAELPYAALSGHALWVEKENRSGFGARQWRVE